MIPTRVTFLPRHIALATLCCAAMTSLPAMAQTKDCPFTPDVLKKAFGVEFDAGKSEPGMGTGCRYRTKGGSIKAHSDFSLGIYVDPTMGTAEAHRKMVIGPMHQYPPVAGDADKAVTVKHGGSVPPFPQIAYERGGKVVNLQISGLAHDPDAKARDALIDQMNRKLLQLPRVP